MNLKNQKKLNSGYHNGILYIVSFKKCFFVNFVIGVRDIRGVLSVSKGCFLKCLGSGDVGAVGVGALVVFISLVLIAGISASVFIQMSMDLELQASRSGWETVDDVSVGVCVDDIWFDSIGGVGDVFGVVIRCGAGSGSVDLSQVVLHVSDGVKSAFLSYNSSCFVEYADIGVDAFGVDFFPSFEDVFFGVMVLHDVDGSVSLSSPVITSGDRVVLMVNLLGVFDGVGPRGRVAGEVLLGEGVSGVLVFDVPMRLNVFSGVAGWATGPTGGGTDYGYGVVVDRAGNVYVTGSHGSGLDFGDGITVADEGIWGVFLAKYNGDGEVMWATGPTGAGFDYGRGVGVDRAGNVYITGYHGSGLDFGDGITVADEGSYGVFFAKYNGDGEVMWASGPTGAGSDYGYGVGVDRAGNVYVTGSHGSGLDFGDGMSLSNSGGHDAFLVKYI
jgi:archaellin